MKKVIRHVRYLDPETGVPGSGNLVLRGQQIRGFTSEEITDADETMEGKGMWVMPGFIDLHVHFREPGGEVKETLETGSRSALAGGFTTVVCMPNTQPVLDSRSKLEPLLEKAGKLPCQLLFMGAVTKELQGKERVNLDEYRRSEIVGITDDGMPVANARIMKEAMVEAAERGMLLANHCEEPALMYDRSINQGVVSRQMGLQGVPPLAEELMVQRDLYLAWVTGAPVHIQHVSTKGSVALIRQAKKRGVRVTAEVTPHHLALTQDAVFQKGSLAVMSPPLREEADLSALRAALADGTIDCIATDHAPHEPASKTEDLVKSAKGVIGLETAFCVAYTSLVQSGVMDLGRLIHCMSTQPARMLHLKHKGSLVSGNHADLVLVDPAEKWTVKADAVASRSQNTPFDGMQWQGRVKATLKDGVVRYTSGEFEMEPANGQVPHI